MTKRSEAQTEHSRRAAQRHGLYNVLAERGDRSLLKPPERSRIVELREQLNESDGRFEVLADKTADIALVLEVAASWLRDEVEAQGPGKAFASNAMSRYATFQNVLRLNVAQLERMRPGDQVDTLGEEILRIHRLMQDDDDDVENSTGGDDGN